MGKSASMTLPTKITIVRLIMIPLILVCYCLQPLYKYLFIVTALLFIIASMTDYLDGHI
ncbi:MAG: CDP-alcohol phosphatidyltransferase family protein, partial [Clostridia bacterium]|nr:CDP-alcohol phosphatidyltransferase family protein [Clostridia bacterium]